LLGPRKRAHSLLLAAGLASESENEKLPYGEDSRWLAAGRLQIRPLIKKGHFIDSDEMPFFGFEKRPKR
jgi:hypothetical protein